LGFTVFWLFMAELWLNIVYIPWAASLIDVCVSGSLRFPNKLID